MNKRTFVVVVLALWGLATAHCDLEQVPGFEFLASCHGAESSPQQGNDCSGDACSVVESGTYKVEESTATVPLPELVIDPLLALLDPSPLAPPALLPTPPPTDSPPELPRVWQFSYRTALLPRAPSFVA